MLPLDCGLMHLPAVTLHIEDEKDIRHGQAVRIDEDRTAPLAWQLRTVWQCRAYAEDGSLVGIIRYDATAGVWRPRKVFGGGVRRSEPGAGQAANLERIWARMTGSGGDVVAPHVLRCLDGRGVGVRWRGVAGNDIFVILAYEHPITRNPAGANYRPVRWSDSRLLALLGRSQSTVEHWAKTGRSRRSGSSR